MLLIHSFTALLWSRFPWSGSLAALLPARKRARIFARYTPTLCSTVSPIARCFRQHQAHILVQAFPYFYVPYRDDLPLELLQGTTRQIAAELEWSTSNPPLQLCRCLLDILRQLCQALIQDGCVGAEITCASDILQCKAISGARLMV